MLETSIEKEISRNKLTSAKICVGSWTIAESSLMILPEIATTKRFWIIKKELNFVKRDACTTAPETGPSKFDRASCSEEKKNENVSFNVRCLSA